MRQVILTVTLPPVTRDQAIARLLATGGRPPPGARRRGRWTPLDLCGGGVWLASDNPPALTAFAPAWSDVVELTLVPVWEDRALSAVLKPARAPSVPTEAHAEDAPPETSPEDSPVAPETTAGTTQPPHEAMA